MRCLFIVQAALNVSEVVARGKVALIEIDKVIQAESEQSFPIDVHAMHPSVGVKISGSDATTPTPTPTPTPPVLLQCLCVITTHPNNRSKLGNVLAIKSKAAGLDSAAAVIYEEPGMGEQSKSHYKVSFRSIDTVDVSVVAQAFGGGGHAKAASCCVERAVVDGWRVHAGAGAGAGVSAVAGAGTGVGAGAGVDAAGAATGAGADGAGAGIYIRQLEPADVAAATAVWASAMRSYGKGYIDQFVAQKLELDMKDAHQEYVASRDKKNFWVAVDSSTETIVGCVGVIFRPAEHMLLAEPPGKAYLSKLVN